MTIQLVIQKERFNGKLTLSNKSLSTMDYCVVSKSERDLLTNTSLTKLLNKIYKYNNPEIKIVLNVDGHRIEKSGELLRDKDKFNCYGYFINEYPLESELFDMVGKDVQIYVEYGMEDSDNES